MYRVRRARIDSTIFFRPTRDHIVFLIICICPSLSRGRVHSSLTLNSSTIRKMYRFYFFSLSVLQEVVCVWRVRGYNYQLGVKSGCQWPGRIKIRKHFRTVTFLLLFQVSWPFWWRFAFFCDIMERFVMTI